jgi:hypothetical protein
METDNRNLGTMKGTAITTSPVEKPTVSNEIIEMANTIVQKPNICVFCGEDLEEGKTPIEHHQFKKMCVN